ncbi:hypothetical protein SAMN07250955_102196 [Arboricoccus pini]|uniref:FIST domain-containing protein n=1 Tax=Arboricoccus pini TaxID=1963835 RepID=A0A212QPY9_9PROT|nr:hypothetical protein [Arboricoccus pini]SNB61354.1 hypothetical protein SAMN07250955_102196 [Arboricoccus pini]
MSSPAGEAAFPSFRAASAPGSDWSRALAACLAQLDPLPAGGNIGFVFLSEALASDADAILNGLRQGTGIERWVGTAAAAVHRQGMREALGQGLAVLAGRLPERSSRLFDAEAYPAGPPGHVALLHVAADLEQAGGRLEELARNCAFWSMGGTTHRSILPLAVAGCLSEGGITGVCFTEDLALVPIVVRAGVNLGAACRLDGRLNRTLTRLDGSPALTVALERAGDLLRHRPSLVAQQISIGVGNTGEGVRTVARVVGIDEGSGGLILDRDLPPTDHVYLLRRDGASAQAALKDAAAQARRRLGDRFPQALIYYVPRDRQQYLLGPCFDEVGSMREMLGMPPSIGVVVDQTIVDTQLESLTSVALIIA